MRRDSSLLPRPADFVELMYHVRNYDQAICRLTVCRAVYEPNEGILVGSALRGNQASRSLSEKKVVQGA